MKLSRASFYLKTRKNFKLTLVLVLLIVFKITLRTKGYFQVPTITEMQPQPDRRSIKERSNIYHYVYSVSKRDGEENS